MTDQTKFRNKYKTESTRLKEYDYSSDGAYFVTVCTKDREYFFGNIVDGEMKLSAIGEMVKNEWLKTAEIRKNVILDFWVIMPNHLHLIVVISNNDVFAVETHCNASLRTPVQPYKNSFGPQSNNLSSIIRGFKGATTKNIHIAGFSEFSWQSRFYDRIIRTEDELNRIRLYIQNNPINWENDQNNVENICI